MQASQNMAESPLKKSLSICKLMFKYALIFGCCINILMLAPPVYSMQVLDRVLSSANLDTLLFLTIVIVCALMFLSLLQTARHFAIVKMGAWLERQMSEKLFSHSLKNHLNGISAGEQPLRDLTKIKSYLTSQQFVNILDMPWAIIFIIVLFLIHPYMGCLAIIGGILLIITGLISNTIMKPLNDKRDTSYIQSMQQVGQAARNAEVIQVMGMFPDVIKNWQKINQDVQSNQNAVGMKQSIFTEIGKLVRMVLQISGTGLGALLVLRGEISVGAIIASSAITSRALAPFEAAIASWKLMLEALKAYNRLEQNLQNYSESAKCISLPPPEGKLLLENVFFQASNAKKYIIKGVNFAVEAGEILVIIGASASGKTTLAKLIVGAYQAQEGSIRIDNANLKDWNPEELGKYMGYLPQSVELFAGTIKQNISRMDNEASSEKIIEAAKQAGVHDMILRLSDGYETVIGPDGRGLSGGQRQRIGLARAFYGEPKLIVLDEPNSNLDNFGEAALSEALIRIKEKKITTIVISHRTSILNIADKVMLLKDGSVAMFGNRDDVLSQASKTNQWNAKVKNEEK